MQQLQKFWLSFVVTSFVKALNGSRPKDKGRPLRVRYGDRLNISGANTNLSGN